jgi:hypothetical protein
MRAEEQAVAEENRAESGREQAESGREQAESGREWKADEEKRVAGRKRTKG